MASPGGQIVVSVETPADGRLTYSVALAGQAVLGPSALGLVVDGTDLGQGARMAGPPSTRQIDESYTILGNHPKARNQARETTIPCEAGGQAFAVVVRAYDDGAAVRYLLPEGAKRIDGEATSWTLAAEPEKVVWSGFSKCYEELSHATPWSGLPEGQTVMLPVTVKTSSCYVAISEADCENFPDLAARRQGLSFVADLYAAPKGWEIKRRADEARPGGLDGTYQGRPASPWRYTVIAKDLTGIVNSDLLTNLCPPPPKGLDFSWVKPGRCLWQWWSVDAPKYEEQTAWYDAAAKLKWEYYLIDDGWRVWKKEGKTQWDLLKEVIDYGKKVGVRTIVWVDSKEMREAKSRRAYLEKIKASGASGIKIDFIPDANADIMQWYVGGIEDCAALKLLVNFHGSVKPTGLRRTYPCDITREAVRGDEWHMSRYRRVMPLTQDVTLPFARPLAGPADITPVMMDPKELKTAPYTWPHEFAQAIVFLSPVTHFCDQYKFYVGSPAEDLFQRIPTVWDETRVLPATEMGEVVAYARRHGGTWWVGVMNGEKERDVSLPMDFLSGGGRAIMLYDHATENTAFDRREQAVKATDTLKLHLRPGGGFVAVISRPGA